ncbi:MAG: prepilin-type N-terminal cleavage/methylation domain-containing protein [Xanthomonadaceae bacterium]|nr:prepilin-type N-terminal cleavage/methylation domain-containing protein [Xanthomonadaceae bacterium]MDE2309004.1 prepilin-type N-terminal cleavage/methylation domain-containing protein [Xanthomonadaceae bacterium]
MSDYSTNRGARPRRRRQARGFTLIELMVAMLLGLIVIAGVVSVFLAGQQSYRTNQALGDVQDGSRIAFEMMARDIRDAGLTGCNNNGRVANVLNNSPLGGGTDWWANMGNALHGYTTGQVDPAVAFGTTSSPVTRVAATDSLQLIGAVGTGLSVASTPAPTAANFHLNDLSPDLATGDVIVVCDPDHAAVLQITSYQSSNVTVVHNDGTGTPGNCSKGLGYPTVCSPNGNGYTYGANSQVFKLGATDWFIGNSANAASGKSLYRMDVVNTAGTLTPTAQEMVPDVTDMKIVYHQSGGASYVNAATVANWALVDAVQVTLTLQSSNQRAGTNAKPITRTFISTTTVRNRVK